MLQAPRGHVDAQLPGVEQQLLCLLQAPRGHVDAQLPGWSSSSCVVLGLALEGVQCSHHYCKTDTGFVFTNRQ